VPAEGSDKNLGIGGIGDRCDLDHDSGRNWGYGRGRDSGGNGSWPGGSWGRLRYLGEGRFHLGLVLRWRRGSDDGFRGGLRGWLRGGDGFVNCRLVAIGAVRCGAG
jgi:hypothetical protein